MTLGAGSGGWEGRSAGRLLLLTPGTRGSATCIEVQHIQTQLQGGASPLPGAAHGFSTNRSRAVWPGSRSRSRPSPALTLPRPRLGRKWTRPAAAHRVGL